jgi:hypothetical protein
VAAGWRPYAKLVGSLAVAVCATIRRKSKQGTEAGGEEERAQCPMSFFTSVDYFSTLLEALENNSNIFWYFLI